MSVVVVIITDGYENASRFFSYHDIAKKIADLENTNKWTLHLLELILMLFIHLKC